MMHDYESTSKALRCCRLTSERGCAECPFSLNSNEKCANLLLDAADAIEELLAAFCLLCGICASPPSAETFNSCEIVRGCLPEPPKEVE